MGFPEISALSAGDHTDYGSTADVGAMLDVAEQSPGEQAGGRGSPVGRTSSMSALSSAPSLSGVKGLPDLSDRLMKAGIYAEYNAYRHRYLQWRRGGSHGATGELTASALRDSADPAHFEYWYPTPSIFKWRYTMAYWKSILFLVGSLMFTFDAAAIYFRFPGCGAMAQTVPNALGASFFTIGCYFGFLQMININTDDEDHVLYLFPSWSSMAQRLQVSSVIGTGAYLAGSLVFNVGACTVLFPHLPRITELTLVELSNVFGSLCFVIGGVCEIAHNGICMGGATLREPVFWASIANFIGGVNFLLGSLPGLSSPEAQRFANANYLMGGVCFTFSSALLIVMWRANDFGLTLLRQLNLALRTGGFVGLAASSSGRVDRVGVRMSRCVDDVSSQVGDAADDVAYQSIRGSVLLIMYCWFVFVAMIICLFLFQEFIRSGAGEKAPLQLCIDLAMQVFVVMVIALVLVIHSVVAEVPEEQPYSCALLTARMILVLGAVVQTIEFIKFIKGPLGGIIIEDHMLEHLTKT